MLNESNQLTKVDAPPLSKSSRTSKKNLERAKNFLLLSATEQTFLRAYMPEKPGALKLVNLLHIFKINFCFSKRLDLFVSTLRTCLLDPK